MTRRYCRALRATLTVSGAVAAMEAGVSGYLEIVPARPRLTFCAPVQEGP
jgi:hypothetical protein